MTTRQLDDNRRAFHDFEHAGWDNAAEHYADTFGDLTRQTAGALLDAAGVGPHRCVLDVACGPGFVAEAAHNRGAEVVAIDFSSAMIALARRRCPHLEFQEGDAETLAFADATFDAVVMNFGLLHLARPETALAEAFRVLRPGRRYAFTIWAPPEQAVGFGMVLKAVEAHGRTDVGLPEGPPFFRFSAAEESRRVVQHVGFTNVDVRTLPLTWTLRRDDDVFDAVSRGGVRTSALLRAQTPEALNRIRDAVRDSVQAFATGGVFEIPMPAVLVSAATPVL